MKQVGELIFLKGAIWVAALQVLWLLRSLWGLRIEFSRIHKRKFLMSMSLATLLVAICARSYPPSFKVLGDEFNLSSVSHSIWALKKPVIIYMGFPETATSADDFGTLIPARPIFHSFMAAVVHFISGYRFENMFYLNMILFALLLSVIIYLGYLYSHSAWVAATLALLSLIHPVVPFHLTSGVFDVSSMVFFFFMLLSFYFYTQKQTQERLSLFMALLSIFASIRYESPLVAIVFLFAILFTRQLLWRDFIKQKIPLLVLLLPLALICVQQWVKQEETTWPVPNGESYFAIKNILVNLWGFQYVFRIFDKTLAYSSLTFVLTVFVAVFYTIQFLLRKKASTGNLVHKKALYTILGIILFSFLFMLSTYYGMADLQVAQRYQMLPLTVLSFLLFVGLYRLMESVKARGLMLFILFFGIFIFEFNRAEFVHSGTMPMANEMRKITSFVREKTTKNDLFIFGRANQLTLLPRDAIKFTFFNPQFKGFFMQQKTGRWQNIWALQYYDQKTLKALPNEELDPSIEQVEVASFDDFKDKGYGLRILKLSLKQ